MAIQPSGFKECSPITCFGSVGSNGYEGTVIDNMESSFELSPNYEPVYVVKDSSKEQEFLHDTSLDKSYGVPMYKSWIYDGTESTQTVGRKYIQMYPYKPPVLETGDYVCWDYHKNGIKSTWLVIALDGQTIYEQVGSIRQCTNEMRFYDDSGRLVKVPCVFDNKINSEKNVSLANLKYINGIVTVYMQLNSDSNLIKENQRFLFGRPGNWVSFRVVSVGVNNFMNEVFWDNETATLLEVTMEGSYVNYLTDDIVNGIADVVEYSVSIDGGSISGVPGSTTQLSADVFRNSVPSDNRVIWSSSDASIASISEDGLVTFESVGIAKITATMVVNESAFAQIEVTVTDTPVSAPSIVISPYGEDDYGILQGDTQTFTCFVYDNGEKQSDVFSFNVDTGIPDASFKFKVIDGNSFSVKNNKMSSGYINIICNSGSYSEVIKIKLKGGW